MSACEDRASTPRAPWGSASSAGRAWVLVLAVVAGIAVVMVAGPWHPVAAADPIAVLAQAPAPAKSIEAVLTNIRNWIMGIATAVATVFITVGAVRYMAAGGDLGEVEKAKLAFRSAAYGYGIAVLAPLVVSVLTSIVGAG